MKLQQVSVGHLFGDGPEPLLQAVQGHLQANGCEQTTHISTEQCRGDVKCFCVFDWQKEDDERRTGGWWEKDMQTMEKQEKDKKSKKMVQEQEVQQKN